MRSFPVLNTLRTFSCALLAALALWMLPTGCAKVSSFGEELLQDQVANYDGDTLSVICTVEYEDSVLTSDRNSSVDYFLVGELNDPQFGRSSSELFSQITLSGQTFDFENPRFDSMFLILPYVASGVYGDTLSPQTLQVFQLADTIKARSYYDHESINAAQEIGRLDNFLPQPNTVRKIITDTSSTATKFAYLKVPMTQAFGEYLMGVDSIKMTSDVAFWRETKGLKITSTSGGSAPGAMLAFDLNNSNCYIRLYYTVRDSVHKTLNYYLYNGGSNKFTHFTHDYAGSPAEAAVGATNPSLLFLQGMRGMRLKVEFPTASSYQNILVNKAQLELTAAKQPGDPASLLPVSQLILNQKQGDTLLTVISDVTYAVNRGGLGTYFGGIPEAEVTSLGTVDRYRLTVTQHFQDIVDATGTNPNNRTLYVNVFPQRVSARRVVLYGATATDFKAQLVLKYTKL